MSFEEKTYLGLGQSGFHRIVYNDWGSENKNLLVCVHGLTGNGHDFDDLACALVQKNYRVIAVDLPGRGRSDFLSEPLDYNYKQYCQDLIDLLNHIGCTEPRSIDWLGVSLGGLIGMRLAAMKNTPIRRLILNDIGPDVPSSALEYIYQIIRKTYIFDSVPALEKRMRETRGLTWGPLSDTQWNHMARHNARALDDGQITYAYDPDISVIFENEPIGEIDLWSCWQETSCPVMVIQGKASLLLTDEIINKMRKTGPEFDLTVFDDCGHVPSLMAPEHIGTIETWLEKTT